MNRISTLFSIVVFAMLFLSGCFNVKNSRNFIYEKLSSAQYKTMLKDSANYYLIDVRTPKEYRKIHIPGAVNASYLSFRYGKKVDSLNREKLAFVYCQTCHRSPLAARRMKRKGFRKVYDLSGGFQRYEMAK
ncbi:MAG TPA: rhodanese-like domain-containing protein [Cytophagaceae bacterium]|jgi:rhodanese-related sulfurtransferase|nr:rhodanese-like domain-containing protein [Cytophagaceae bacterium]